MKVNIGDKFYILSAVGLTEVEVIGFNNPIVEYMNTETNEKFTKNWNVFLSGCVSQMEWDLIKMFSE